MKELMIIIRPEKLETVKNIMEEMGCGGMTISSVMGCGTQKGYDEESGPYQNQIKGFKTTINLLPKIRVEAVMRDSMVEPVIARIREELAEGHVGDGKIFIRSVEDVVRIRTGDRGKKAL